MDKNKIIDDILSEWAMRSHDGLVSGHDTPENIEVLNEILAELGLRELWKGDWDVSDETGDKKTGGRPAILKLPRDRSYYDKDENGREILVGHPNYADGTFVDDVAKNSPSVKWYTAAQKAKLELGGDARQKRIDKNIWDDLQAPNGKGVGEKYVDQIKTAIIKKAKIFDYAKSIYNKKSVPEALKLYNTNSGDAKKFVDAMNSIQHQGLGRGEMAFVFMLRDVKSGGIGDVDLINVEGYGKVEVKEVGGKKAKETVRISSSTLKGFSNSKFKNAIEDLAQHLRKNSGFGDFLLKVLNGKDADTDEYLYKGARPPTDEEARIFEDFVRSPNTADMPKGLFRSLVIISVKLELPTVKKKDIAKVSIAVGGDKQEFGTDSVSALQQMKVVSHALNTEPNKPQKIALKVKPTVGKSDEEYKQLAMELDFFDAKYNLKTISDEIAKLLAAKYKGMLIVSAGQTNSAEIIDTDKIEMEFDSMAQNMIVCNVKTDLSNLSGTK